MNLEDLLSRFSDVEETADGWLAKCPAHKDSHASLRVAVGDRAVILKCRAGCATTDVLKAAGLSFADLPRVADLGPVVRRAASHEGEIPVGEIAALAARLDGYADVLHDGPPMTAEGEAARTYMSKRFGLDYDAAKRLGLGVATDLLGGPRLVVPFLDRDGNPRGFQARALDPSERVRWTGPKSPSAGSWAKVAFLPGDAGWTEVIVTEGPGDGLTACAVGYDVAFIPGAAHASNSAVVAEIAAFAGDRPVVVFGDADAAGETFARTLVGGLASHGVQVVSAKPDAGDVTAWRERDPEGFATAFIRRVSEAVAQTPDSIEARLSAYSESVLTDLGMAERLRTRIEGSGSGVKWTPEVGFYLLDGGVWRVDHLDVVRTEAQESARALWRDVEALEAEIEGLPEEQAKRHAKRLGRLRAFAKHANSSRGLDAMVRELQALSGVAADVNAFDAHPHLLAVRNGVVNLRTARLQGHDPALLLTRRIDVDYDPEAKAPRWERFLSEVFRDYPDLPAYMRRLVGYGITGDTSEQCFAVLWGTGANGKSVFTDTLTEVFREVTTTTPFQTFEERSSGGIPNDLAALKGARLVMASEGEQGRPMAEAVLKRVTGRDLISARFMRKEFFEFRPSFLLMLATNYKPQFRGQDEGLWRRVKLLPWSRYFEPHERDHRLGATLLAEREGIVAWAVKGAAEWYADGLQDPDVVVRSTTEYRETSDALAGFMGKDVLSSVGYIVTGEEKDVVTGRVLWDAYQTWTDEENLPARERWTRRTFFAALEERGVVKRKRGEGVVFLGIRKVRVTDHAAAVEDDGAEEEPLAPSSPVPAPVTGPSLDGALP